MALWHSLALWVFHALYNLSEIIIAVCHILSVELKQCDTDELLPRAKLPAHLAVAFTTSITEKTARQGDGDDDELVESMLESAKNVVHWCGHVGIATLTFYDRHGLLKSRFRELHAALMQHEIETVSPRPNETVSRKFHEYITPPTSDDSTSTSMIDGADVADEVHSFTFFGSRILKDSEAGNGHDLAYGRSSLGLKKRRPFSIPLTNDLFRVRVNVISEANGVPTIVHAARTLALTRTRSPSEPAPPVTVQQMDNIIHGELAPPELLVLHHMEYSSIFKRLHPRAMDMFPPWQLRLTEIHFSAPRYASLNPLGWYFGSGKSQKKYPLLKRSAFAAALKEYSKSVAREGK